MAQDDSRCRVYMQGGEGAGGREGREGTGRRDPSMEGVPYCTDHQARGQDGKREKEEGKEGGGEVRERTNRH
eukprot:3397914-Prorocentrum_lima.AAC.1